MKLLAVAFSLCAIASANVIDVSSQTTQLLQSGDALEFFFSDTSYAAHASAMGLSPYPGKLSFVFVSAAGSDHGSFTAELETPSGDFSAPFPAPVAWTSGYIQNSSYSGDVSALAGSLTLSSGISQELFSDSEAELILTYTGPDITISRPGATLRQDLTVSLSGGPLSTGAAVYDVDLETSNSPAPALFRTFAVVASTPEPESAMLLGAGVVFCALAGALKRLRKARS
jgi:hypothetical protein